MPDLMAESDEAVASGLQGFEKLAISVVKSDSGCLDSGDGEKEVNDTLDAMCDGDDEANDKEDGGEGG